MLKIGFEKVRIFAFLGFLLIATTGLTLLGLQYTVQLFQSFIAFEAFVIFIFLYGAATITKELRQHASSSSRNFSSEYSSFLRRIRHTTLICSFGSSISLMGNSFLLTDIDFPGRNSSITEAPLWMFGYLLLFLGIAIDATSLVTFGTYHAMKAELGNKSKTLSNRMDTATISKVEASVRPMSSNNSAMVSKEVVMLVSKEGL